MAPDHRATVLLADGWTRTPDGAWREPGGPLDWLVARAYEIFQMRKAIDTLVAHGWDGVVARGLNGKPILIHSLRAPWGGRSIRGWRAALKAQAARDAQTTVARRAG